MIGGYRIHRYLLRNALAARAHLGHSEPGAFGSDAWQCRRWPMDLLTAIEYGPQETAGRRERTRSAECRWPSSTVPPHVLGRPSQTLITSVFPPLAPFPGELPAIGPGHHNGERSQLKVGAPQAIRTAKEGHLPPQPPNAAQNDQTTTAPA